MRQHVHIVILTAGYGNGHIQAARTLEQSFYRSGADSVSIIDLYREAHPGMNSVSRYLYLYSPYFSAYGFDYYGWSYYATRHIDQNNAVVKWSNLLGARKLAAILNKQRPDAVVSTFPFGGISEQLRKHGLPIPCFTVVTDFTLHNRWLYTAPDRFYVATEDLRKEISRSGVPYESIVVSGIPVRDAFCEPPAAGTPLAAGSAGAKHGHGSRSRRPSVLVMMGAHIPLPDVQPMIAQLLELPDVDIDIVCGGNDKLRQRLERHCRGNSRIRLYGYVEDIHKLMRAASCMITKAGGITLAEAIQCRTPIVLYKPFPGQERENARYLLRKGAVAVASHLRQVADHVDQILHSEVKRNRMLRQYEALAKEHASDAIARDVLRFADSRLHNKYEA